MWNKRWSGGGGISKEDLLRYFSQKVNVVDLCTLDTKSPNQHTILIMEGDNEIILGFVFAVYDNRVRSGSIFRICFNNTAHETATLWVPFTSTVYLRL